MKITNIFSGKEKKARKESSNRRFFYVRVKARFGNGIWYYRKLEEWEIIEYAATGDISIHPYDVTSRHWYGCAKKTTLRNLTVLDGSTSFSGFYFDVEPERSGFATIRQLNDKDSSATSKRFAV